MNMKKWKLMRSLLIGLVIAGCLSSGYAVLEKKMSPEEKSEDMARVLDEVSGTVAFTKAVTVIPLNREIKVDRDLLKKWKSALKDLCDVETRDSLEAAQDVDEFLAHARSYVAYYLDSLAQKGKPYKISNEGLLALTNYIKLPKDVVSANVYNIENKNILNEKEIEIGSILNENQGIFANKPPVSAEVLKSTMDNLVMTYACLSKLPEGFRSRPGSGEKLREKLIGLIKSDAYMTFPVDIADKQLTEFFATSVFADFIGDFAMARLPFKLNFNSQSKLTDNAVAKVLSLLPGLQWITMDGCTAITDSVIQELSYDKGLVRVSINTKCQNISSKAFARLANCKQLSVLCADALTNVDDEAISLVCENAKFRILALENSNIGQLSMKALAKNGANLESIYLENCRYGGITLKMIVELIPQSPKLSYVGLTGSACEYKDTSKWTLDNLKTEKEFMDELDKSLKECGFRQQTLEESKKDLPSQKIRINMLKRPSGGVASLNLRIVKNT